MEKILKFLRIDPKKKAILIQAFVLQLVVRLALGVLPFYGILGILQRIRRANTHTQLDPTNSLSIENMRVPLILAWAIRSTSLFVPGSRCLCQAITGQIMMSINGIPTELRIGVQKSGSSMLSAHAWLVRQEVILIGNLPDIADYMPLPNLPNVIK